MLLAQHKQRSQFAHLFSSNSRTVHSLSLTLLVAMASISTCLMLAYAFLGASSNWIGGVSAEVPSSPDVSPSLQDILDKAHKGPLYTYPTSLTQGILPVCSSLCGVWDLKEEGRRA